VAGKITGPGSGPPGSGPVGGSDESLPSAGGPRFADKLGQTDAAAQAPSSAPAKPGGPIGHVGHVGNVGNVGNVGLTADLAADLRAGKITPKAAVDRVIDRVVEKQLGADAPTATREKLRAALEDAVADDPLLADKIRSLG
jgi:hypothetical protein